jgi:hypothetical protein
MVLDERTMLTWRKQNKQWPWPVVSDRPTVFLEGLSKPVCQC